MKLFRYNTLPYEQQRNIFPKWISNNAIAVYVVLLLVISLAFISFAMEWYFMLIGLVQVAGFFYFVNYLSKKWGAIQNPKLFVRRLFWIAISIRIVWVLFSYWFYYHMTGGFFDFAPADVLFYNEMGRYGHKLISHGVFPTYAIMSKYAGGLELGDYGYPLYLSVVYTIVNDSLLLTRIIKCFISAWTVVLIYRLASRNFGEKVGRITGIICMLMPNLIYYCSMHLKETEMVFVTVVAINLADQLIRSERLDIKKTLLMILAIGTLFLFRTALAAVVVLAIICALVFSSTRVIKWGKRILLGVLVVGMLGVAVGNRVSEDVSALVEQGVDRTNQQSNMQWRSVRSGGNSYAKYAGAAVFAPLIFTIPFSTMVAVPGQEGLRMIHGGNYIKNITSFFAVLSVLMLLFSGDWKKHVLPLSFMLGYLAVLVLSSYAQSERFHMPVLCFELMFAAYAISQSRTKEKKWFNYWLLFVFVANVAWAWFKLKGRGLV